jgi:NADPH2 dehydrogenase
MAKYFKYKSIEDLQLASSEMGLGLRFQDDLNPLFQELPIANRIIGNRFCIHPMEGCDGELDGSPGPLTIRRYQRFGSGGAKLIWGEATAVFEEGRANPRQLWLHDGNIDAFKSMVDTCKQAHRDAGFDDSTLLFGLQLTHSGRYSYHRPLIVAHDPLLDAKTFTDKTRTKTVDSSYPLLSDAELSALIEPFVHTAKLAVQAGFDFLDLKQCHRYLLNELLGARNRPGIYGGSYENRTRLFREIVSAIKAELPDVILGTRMNLFDGIPFNQDKDGNGIPVPIPEGTIPNGWGIDLNNPLEPDLSEVIRWVDEMRQLGISIVNATLGNPYAQPHFGRPFEYPPPDGYESPEHPLIGVNRHFQIAATVQQANPNLPLVGTGYSYLQAFAFNAGAANLAENRIQVVGLGRGSLSQPDFVKQLQQHGKLDNKRICRTFSYCTAMMRSKQHPLGQFEAGCPPFDKEVYGPLWQEIQQLNNKS